jgi:phosphoglycerate dehydrogenase-like enzyme
VTSVLIEASIVADADRARLVDRFPAVHFTFVDHEAAWNDNAATAEVIFAKGVPSAAIARAVGLRWLQVGTAGVDRWLGSDIIGRGVVLTNASGAHGVPIAEQVLAMALSFATGLNILMRARGEHRDARRRVYAQKFELEGQTMLVIGLGDIGGTLAAKA